MVEREDVEPAVVAESHGSLLLGRSYLVSPKSSGYDARVEHRFRAPPYTIGIEEELMIVDRETLDLSSSIEALLEGLDGIETERRGQAGADGVGLRDRHGPVPQHARGRRPVRSLRRLVQQVAHQRGLGIGSAGTHPFALWEDQRACRARATAS